MALALVVSAFAGAALGLVWQSSGLGGEEEVQDELAAATEPDGSEEADDDSQDDEPEPTRTPSPAPPPRSTAVAD